MTYGCHNRPLLPPAADVFSPRCNYDRRERDAGCAGCRFRVVERLGGTSNVVESENADGSTMHVEGWAALIAERDRYRERENEDGELRHVNDLTGEVAPTELDELARRYHAACEAYDRSVCTGPTRDGFRLPASHREMMLITHNAMWVRQRLVAQARELGFTAADLARAIIDGGAASCDDG